MYRIIRRPTQALQTWMACVWLLMAGFGSLQPARAQDFLGVATSEYAGLLGLDLNPAFIADNRYRFDFTLIGAQGSFENNFVYSNTANLLSDINGGSWASVAEAFPANRDGDIKEAFTRTSVTLPSFMISLNNGMTLAITNRFRYMLGIQDLDATLAEYIYDGYAIDNVQDFVNGDITLNASDLNAQTLSFSEHGVAFAMPIWKDREHEISAGARVKLIIGLFAGYAYVEDLSYQIEDSAVIDVQAGGTFEFGYSSTVPSAGVNSDDEFGNGGLQFISRPTVGLDFGFAYKWKPEWWTRRSDRQQYFLKAGFAVQDLGRVRFANNSEAYVANIEFDQTVNLEDYTNSGDFEEFRANVDSAFTIDKVEPNFNLALPARLIFSADLNLYEGFYVNAMASVATKLNPFGSREFNNYSLTPRWDARWLGFSLPLQFNSLGNFNMGIGLRLGPIWVGSNTFSALFKKEVYGTDVYAVAKIPIFRKNSSFQ